MLIRMNRPTHTYELMKTSDEVTDSYVSLQMFVSFGYAILLSELSFNVSANE